MILYISLLFSCGNEENNQKKDIPDSTEEEREQEEAKEQDCNDMLDNDNNGQVDCADLDCSSSENCSSHEEQPTDSGDVMDINQPDNSEPEDILALYTLDLGNEVLANFVLITNGTFARGSPAEEIGQYTDTTYGIDEEQYEFTLMQNFYVLTTEVTQGMFEALMNYDSREGESTNYGTGINRPAYYSKWHMSAVFANSMTERYNTNHESNLEICYDCEIEVTGVQCSETVNPYQCDGYRLLTEAE